LTRFKGKGFCRRKTMLLIRFKVHEGKTTRDIVQCSRKVNGSGLRAQGSIHGVQGGRGKFAPVQPDAQYPIPHHEIQPNRPCPSLPGPATQTIAVLPSGSARWREHGRRWSRTSRLAQSVKGKESQNSCRTNANLPRPPCTLCPVPCVPCPVSRALSPESLTFLEQNKRLGMWVSNIMSRPPH
jgi:hypothetical protein